MTIDSPASAFWDSEAGSLLIPGIDQPDFQLHEPSRLDAFLTRVTSAQSLWLTPVLILQAILAFRLSNSLEEDEALYINSGHQIISNMLHGTTIPDFGSYFSGVPSVYTVPAAMLDRVGGANLVHAANTVTMMAATVLVYLITRRLFGHGAAIISAAIFATNPATIFVARFASSDATSVLFLVGAFYFAVRATDRRFFAVLTGLLIVAATAEKYFAFCFLPSLLAVVVVANLRQAGRRRTVIALALSVSTVVAAGLIGAALLAHDDWVGLSATSLSRHILLPEPRLTLLHASWTYIGPLTVVGFVAVFLLGRTWLLGALLLITAIIPVAAQIDLGESASLHKNIAFGVVFLAPIVGVTGMALVRQGRWLAVRAPIALVAIVLVLSSGIGTSAAMVRGWPNSTRIDNVLAKYVQRGNERYLADGSSIPSYYLSHLTNYTQWISTYDPLYNSPGGAQRLRNLVADGAFRLVLYRSEDATPDLDRAMVSTLRRRYTLVAKVPLGSGDTRAYWYVWLSELPR